MCDDPATGGTPPLEAPIAARDRQNLLILLSLRLPIGRRDYLGRG